MPAVDYFGLEYRDRRASAAKRQVCVATKCCHQIS